MTQLIKDLNWRTLEQQRIDSRRTRMYKITYDLVAITTADYQIPNTRQSRHNHQLAYSQIPTLEDYTEPSLMSPTEVKMYRKKNRKIIMHSNCILLQTFSFVACLCRKCSEVSYSISSQGFGFFSRFLALKLRQHIVDLDLIDKYRIYK